MILVRSVSLRMLRLSFGFGVWIVVLFILIGCIRSMLRVRFVMVQIGLQMTRQKSYVLSTPPPMVLAFWAY